MTSKDRKTDPVGAHENRDDAIRKLMHEGVRAAADCQGLTIADLAERLGVGRETLHMASGGHRFRRGISPALWANIVNLTPWPIERRIQAVCLHMAASVTVASFMLAELLPGWFEAQPDKDVAWRKLVSLASDSLRRLNEIRTARAMGD